MSLKKILDLAGFYLMVGIVLIGVTLLIVGFGTKNSPPNIYIISTGVIILLPFVIYLLFDEIKSSKEKKKKEIELIEFKKTAEKVNVNLKDLVIKSNSWNEIVITDKTSYAGFNELSGNGHRNIKSVTKNINYVNVKIPYQGRTINYNLSIPMDRTKLELYFAIHGKTTLYIDRNDKNKMYLDLEFIE